MNRAVVQIPRGFRTEGTWTRTATVQELTGHDEEAVADASALSTPMRASILLGRLVSIHTHQGTALDAAEDLAIGDRAALILGARRMLFGENLDCVVTCPSCANDMSVRLTVNQLTRLQWPEPAVEQEFEICGYRLGLRPVMGKDLELACEPNFTGNREEALIRSCVVSSDPPLPQVLSEQLLSSISEKLESLDPQADIQLAVECPTCASRFETPFSAEAFVLKEVESMQNQLEKEVHWIAFNYNWTEDEILSLPLTKRKRYVELINKTLSGEQI